ncbi:hypothetical protein SAMN05444156_1411 [Verrucomicrobium sp. GAS474]|uniref:metallophosphoesterase n=1 Tax=Verrucomicrobium sp. GAS474 TaxID=1882831 RepID=UPI00087D4BCF|nr:metallophosphoesterase [Verrucomicrobium sp. GAS474]SDU00832.1 hypothetical protein SAMN05444156_1411 [Verrucomicrobium sp. GAS474]
MNRRKFLSTVGLGAAAVGGFYAEQRFISPIHGALEVTEYTFPGPASLIGKKIVMISDLHYGFYFGERETRVVLDRVAELNPDIVMLPGDLTDKAEYDMSDFLFLYGEPKWKTYFSPGNHDKVKADDDRIERQVKDAGWIALCNDKVEFDDYAIIGMQSGLMGPIDYDLIKTPKYKIVLGHEPDYWSRYTAPDLLHLAGHTHGGQILFFGEPIMLPTDGKVYVKGYYKRANNNHLIVGRGIGCKFVNMRVGAPPEIISITFT